MPDRHAEAAEPVTVSFPVPEGGTDTLLDALIRAGRQVVCVYERLDPSTRAPVVTWIGLRANTSTVRGPTDPFTVLRNDLRHGERSHDALPTFAFVGFPQDDGSAARAAAGSEDTPRALLMTLLDHIRIDHATGTARLTWCDPNPLPDDRSAETSLVTALRAATPNPVPDRGDQSASFRWEPVVSKSEYAAAVDRLKQELATMPDTSGVVLSVQMASPMRADPLASFRTLRRINPSTCMFLVQHGDFALWGSTSLSLVEVVDGRLVAETDGATRVVSADGPGIWTPTAKEVSEYDVVASGLHDDIEPIAAAGSLRFTAEREQRTFFGLSHLFAEVQADLAAGVDAVAAVQALFPHGAAVGHPRAAAVELIKELETLPRGPFAGAIGVFTDAGTADVASVTRSMWTTPSGSFAQAGAKVVRASDPGEEYDESTLKTRALQQSARTGEAQAGSGGGRPDPAVRPTSTTTRGPT